MPLRSTDAWFVIPALGDERPTDPLLAAASSSELKTAYRAQPVASSSVLSSGQDGSATPAGPLPVPDLTDADSDDGDDGDARRDWLSAWLQRGAPSSIPTSSWDAAAFPSSPARAGLSIGAAQPPRLVQALLSASLGSATKTIVSWHARTKAYRMEFPLSGAASGIELRAIEVGTWARRVEDFVPALRADREVQSVGHAFCSALEALLDSLLRPLHERSEPGTPLELSAALLSAHAVLESLTAALSMQNLARPPKPPIKALREPLNVLGLCWALLKGAISSGADACVVDALRWLWECVGTEWTRGVELWLAGDDDGAWAVGAVKDGSEWTFEEKQVPTFLPEDVARDFYFGGVALRLLRKSAPDHPLCGTGRNPKAERVFHAWSWTLVQAERDLDRWSAREKDIRQRITEYKRMGSTSGTLALSDSALFGGRLDIASSQSSTSTEQQIRALGRLFGSAPSGGLHQAAKPAPSELAFTMAALFERRCELPMASALPVMIVQSLRSLVAHAGLYSQSLLASFFSASEHGNLLDAFSLLSRFVLFRDKFPFVSRLKRALFGDGQTEDRAIGLGARARIRERMGMAPSAIHASGSTRRGGVALGLGLSDRTSWPPGGAELNIALRTSLIESIDEYAANAGTAEAEKSWRATEDRLGFVVRDSPAEDGDRWRDPGRIEALDFLQVSYRPPKELQVVLGRRVLDEYLRIQQVLFRLFRVEAVMRFVHLSTARPGSTAIFPGNSSAHGDLVAFKHVATNFITSLLSWVFDDVLLARYGAWETRLAALSADLLAGRDDDSIGTVQALLASHDRVLGGIVRSLWLGKDQSETMAALVECWTVCLQAGDLVRDGLDGMWASGSAEESAAMSRMRSTRLAFETRYQTFIDSLQQAVRGPIIVDWSPLLVRLDVSRRATGAPR